MTLDEIATAAEEQKRLQQRQQVARMADEIERIKAEDWQAPPDVPRIPETPAPLDWFIRSQIERDREAVRELLDHARQGELHHVEIEDTD